jgi:hypothetical protein
VKSLASRHFFYLVSLFGGWKKKYTAMCGLTLIVINLFSGATVYLKADSSTRRWEAHSNRSW